VPDGGRVITGTAKGMRLTAPGAGTRPLGDRVKQALFGTLESDPGVAWPAPFLDLFAGTGAAGIEALSRGAPLAVLVERDAGAARTIGQDLRRSGLTRGRVVRRDVLAVLREGGRSLVGPFGAALVDPPYDDPRLLIDSIALLGDPALGWMAERGVVVAKHLWRVDPPGREGDLLLERVRRFGETALSYYRRSAGMEGDSQP
jgi:16S rRNA (guanine966-N2)-methyltransferase